MPSSHYSLYHYPLDPASRRVRLLMGEKKVNFTSTIEKPWDPSPDYYMISPAGDVPALKVDSRIEEGDIKTYYLCGSTPICEYIEETIKGLSLLGNSPEENAEIRRLVHWFEYKMYIECTTLIVGEKAYKRLQGTGEPNSAMLRAGYHNINGHLSYIAWLIERRNWLAGEDITLADLTAAAQLSVIDYLSDVPWDKHPIAKEWYARIKSRPSFRPLLGDHIAGLKPAKHYANLDF
ncbi:MAG: glutathione S-transferase family protein [Proteobacteria bacterium]|nr:glutathione S-transferase family protein [Alphaproteobacteria bacterium]NCC02611.1 glutathione S-transferase family protein [Pseudomonadota bacterium]